MKNQENFFTFLFGRSKNASSAKSRIENKIDSTNGSTKNTNIKANTIVRNILASYQILYVKSN